MKPLLATLLLTAAFLSAGAFAGNEYETTGANVTVIAKNQTWPVKGRITVEACKIKLCLDV